MVRIRNKDLILLNNFLKNLFVENDGSREVDGHERRLCHEEVVEPNDVRVVRKNVAEPEKIISLFWCHPIDI